MAEVAPTPQFQKLHRWVTHIHLSLAAAGQGLAWLEGAHAHHWSLLHRRVLSLACLWKFLQCGAHHRLAYQHSPSSHPFHQYRLSNLYDPTSPLTTGPRPAEKEPNLANDLALHPLQPQRVGGRHRRPLLHQLPPALRLRQISPLSLHLQIHHPAHSGHLNILSHPHHHLSAGHLPSTCPLRPYPLPLPFPRLHLLCHRPDLDRFAVFRRPSPQSQL